MVLYRSNMGGEGYVFECKYIHAMAVKLIINGPRIRLRSMIQPFLEWIK